MTREAITVCEDATIDVAIDLIVEEDISGLPVVDKHDQLVGLISEYDVLELCGKGRNDAAEFSSCKTYMTDHVKTIQQHASLTVAAQVFQAASIRRLIVLDGARPVGILSRRDVVRSIRDNRLRLVGAGA